ncbi:hypothetical protein J437_LFUL008783, partial [Ladona fulva]
MHCAQWKISLAARLIYENKNKATIFRKEIQELEESLWLPVTNREDLINVMSTVKSIKNMTIKADIICHEIYTGYEIIRHHGIQVPMEGICDYEKLMKEWKLLHLAASFRLKRLHGRKRKFMKIAYKEIKVFIEDAKAFAQKVIESGPGTVGTDLDLGMELLKMARQLWGKILWNELDPRTILDGMDIFVKDIHRLPKEIQNQPIATVLKEIIYNFKRSIPLIVDLKNDALCERHWQDLMKRTGITFPLSFNELTLENIFAMELHKYQDIAESIISTAVKELGIEKGLMKICEVWNSLEFQLLKHEKAEFDRGYILGGIDEINPVLEDDSMALQSMASSQFVGHFLNTVQKWEKNLKLISETLYHWCVTQAKWLYLEGVFIGGDIRQQMPNEALTFDEIDIAYRKIMLDTSKRKNVKDCCLVQGRLAELQSLISALEGLQKSLNEYLDSKRNVFSRFYFVSDDELLLILGSKEAECVQEHMVKMFDNIAKLRFVDANSDGLQAAAMISCEGEVMEFINPVVTTSRVEDWMNLVLDAMHAANRFITKKAIFFYGKMTKSSVINSKEFEWESQLRSYWVKNIDNLEVQQCTGPAGTGKTETTKDLAKALGLLCIVTNCGEGMDYKSMGKILAGLSQCGAWGCFDEFNRIDVSVLSVVSTQMRTICSALMHKLKAFLFEGQEIKLDDKVGIFITMNPGYAGRTELPESLKALFRPVVCVVPDLELICQIMLFSEGFLSAKVLAKKMTVLYKMAKEQLSKQHHYDFGLRALKSVLVMAGELKRGSPDVTEEVVLIQALRDMNLPKFVFEDVPLFLGLIYDLFPGLNCPKVLHSEFRMQVEESLKREGHTVVKEQVDKVIQLFETMNTRHSTMVVGPTGGGKSVIISMLVGDLKYASPATVSRAG